MKKKPTENQSLKFLIKWVIYKLNLRKNFLPFLDKYGT